MTAGDTSGGSLILQDTQTRRTVEVEFEADCFQFMSRCLAAGGRDFAKVMRVTVVRVSSRGAQSGSVGVSGAVRCWSLDKSA
jgi:hypothetical protein